MAEKWQLVHVASYLFNNCNGGSTVKSNQLQTM